MKKVILSLLIVIACHFSSFGQLEVISNGDTHVASGQSFWLGNTGDSGNRIRFYNGIWSIFDYYPTLYFRSGESGVPTRVVFTSDGKVGINRSSPSYSLDVSGNYKSKFNYLFL